MRNNDNSTNITEQRILRELRLSGGMCSISHLAKHLGVSLETIRRNVKTLEITSVVKKVHGGVHLQEESTEPPLIDRMDTKATTKQLLAAAVAETIIDGDSVFIDIGSTTAYVAKALKHHSNLYVVTNSAFVANTLATRNNNRVFMAGGELRSHDGGAFGAEAIEFIKKFNVKYAIFSCGALNAKDGFTVHDLEEANIARIAMSRAQYRIVVADSDKFDKRAPVSGGLTENIEALFTNEEPSEAILKMLQDNQIEITVPDACKRT